MTVVEMCVRICSVHGAIQCKELVSMVQDNLNSLPASIAKVGKTSLIMSLVSEEFPEVVWRKCLTAMMPLHVSHMNI